MVNDDASTSSCHVLKREQMKSTKMAGGVPDSFADAGADAGAVSRDSGSEPVAILEASTLDVLGSRLRQYYEQIIEEGVPPKFLELLDRLKTS